MGPEWLDLAGSEVELEDGSVVVADEAYLRRSIQEPGAEIVAGYTTRMPQNSLSDEQIDAVVAYISELAS